MSLNKLTLLICKLVSLIGLMASASVWANDPPSPDMPSNLYQLEISNPTRDVGYTVGDTLQRHVVIRVNKPYQLIPTTLPIVGYERRYRGQIIGIELRNIQQQSKQLSKQNEYRLDLEYQVFTNEATAKMAFLPAEIIKFQGAKKDDVVQIRVPSWGFRVSPLAVFGAVKIEQDMSGYLPPFLLQPYPEKQKLVACLIILGISLLGLLYIFGNRAWLPNMGKPFAKAYRQVHKQKADAAGVRQGLSVMHQAMNIAAQTSIFSDNKEMLFAKQPNLRSIDQELQQFFLLSRQVFFENKLAELNIPASHQWLKQFSRHCRDCERGLKPLN